ncbi:hypothetical protein [Aquisediminimonas sediminicola]|uniref:hypothetical protein n=1 Tax=Alteraquisediminimonas sediminicola TaxID=2676787 RepID=UPI001C8ED83B|nr:hypothetical protein [Aquisediminimonas sediminicola]
MNRLLMREEFEGRVRRLRKQQIDGGADFDTQRRIVSRDRKYTVNRPVFQQYFQ